MHVAAWSFVMLNSGVTCNTNFKTCCFMMSPRVRLAVDRSREREEVTWWGSTSCKWIFLLPRALEEASDASPCGKGHSHFKKDPKNLHLSFNFYTHLFSSQLFWAARLINVMLYWCKFLWKLLLYTFFKEPISWPPLNFGCLLKARTCAVLIGRGAKRRDHYILEQFCSCKIWYTRVQK